MFDVLLNNYRVSIYHILWICLFVNNSKRNNQFDVNSS